MGRAIIRQAQARDAEGINEVYNPFILGTAATFELAQIDNESRRRWIERLTANPRCEVLVAEGQGGRILGFASASQFDPRGTYGTSVKVSVFLSPTGRGKGLGRRLYQDLFDALSKCDVHRAYALIVVPNPASVALHEAFDFAHIGTLSEAGRKFGRYYDVMWFEKRL